MPRLPTLLPMRLFTGLGSVLWKPEPFLSAALGRSPWPYLGLRTLRKPDVRLAYQSVSRKQFQFLPNSAHWLGYLASIMYLRLTRTG